MVEPWSAEFSARVREWCDKVSVLSVDVLLNVELVSKGDFERATGIVAEELFVRLCLHDYPPVPESLGKASNAEPKVPPHCGGIT